MKETGAIIVAGGLGIRFGKTQPKALIKIGTLPMFIYPLKVFQLMKREIGSIVLVTPQGWGEKFSREIKKAGLEEPYAIVDGGPRRQDSVRIGLRAIPDGLEYVLIHDAARPFITPKKVRELITLVKINGSATVASRVRDTLKVGDEVSETICLGKTIERDNLFALGTPQGFKLSEILKAHESAQRRGVEVSDDTSLVPKGKKIGVLEADMLNFKITYPEDIRFAEAMLPIWRKQFNS